MIFITDTDFPQFITPEQLAIITKNDSDNLDMAELTAISEIKSYLSGKYDCNAIFDETGADRDSMIVKITCQIMINSLAKANLNPRMISEIWVEDYDKAISWLYKASNDKLNPDLPLLQSDVKSTRVHLGGSKKVSKRW